MTAIIICDEEYRIEDRIFAIRPSGVEGLAVKLHVWLHNEDDLLRHGDPVAITETFINDRQYPEMLAALVKDLHRVLPEIPPATTWTGEPIAASFQALLAEEQP